MIRYNLNWYQTYQKIKEIPTRYATQVVGIRSWWRLQLRTRMLIGSVTRRDPVMTTTYSGSFPEMVGKMIGLGTWLAPSAPQNSHSWLDANILPYTTGFSYTVFVVHLRMVEDMTVSHNVSALMLGHVYASADVHWDMTEIITLTRDSQWQKYNDLILDN